MFGNNNHFLKDSIPPNGDLLQIRKLLITIPLMKMSDRNGGSVVNLYMDDKLDYLNFICQDNTVQE